MSVIFFGSIGSISESSEIQRKSFNRAFKEFGVDWYWNVGNYVKMIQDPGGLNRIKEYSRFKLTNNQAKQIYKLKIKYFKELATNSLKPRKGILDVIKFAKNENIKIGLITTTSKETIDIITQSLSRYIDFSDFDLITHDKHASKRKPDPEIYNFAASYLNENKRDIVSVEDTTVSYVSANKSKLKCIYFPGEYSVNNSNLRVTYNLYDEIKTFFSYETK